MSFSIGAPPERDPRWSPRNPDPATSEAPYRLYDVGTDRPTTVLELVALLEELLGRKAKTSVVDRAAGEVASTCTAMADMREAFGVSPRTGLEDGLRAFVDWYRAHYGV